MDFLKLDRIVRATSDGAGCRLVVVDATRAANSISAGHEAGGYAAQLLGEASAGALLIASGLKGPGTVQLRFALSGDISRLAADATPFGLVRAMIPREEVLRTGSFEPMVLPQTMRVIKLDQDGGRLSEGIVEMASSDLSESLTHYLRQSEQGASVARVSATWDTEAGRLRHAGGILMEMFPGYTEKNRLALEERVKAVDFTAHRREGSEGLDLDSLMAFFGDFGLKVHKEFEIEPFCPCSEEGVLRALSSLGREGLESLFLEGAEAELFCEFCRKRYVVGQAKLLEMLNEAEENEG
ncbi:MAG TPA: Hsp33 family molecular chaperone HslO [Fibrobacteria bacterium]|jgi:molecular chaperone Hsp33|nr:Hsp33 family molecular chaperone HslO [Fibrobacteria bacterium]